MISRPRQAALLATAATITLLGGCSNDAQSSKPEGSAEPIAVQGTSPISPTGSAGPATTAAPKAEYAAWCNDFKGRATAVNRQGELVDRKSQEDAEAYRAAFESVYVALASSVPEPIRADWNLVVAKLQAADRPSKFQQLESDAEFTNAAVNINRWLPPNCGFAPQQL